MQTVPSFFPMFSYMAHRLTQALCVLPPRVHELENDYRPAAVYHNKMQIQI